MFITRWPIYSADKDRWGENIYKSLIPLSPPQPPFISLPPLQYILARQSLLVHEELDLLPWQPHHCRVAGSSVALGLWRVQFYHFLAMWGGGGGVLQRCNSLNCVCVFMRARSCVCISPEALPCCVSSSQKHHISTPSSANTALHPGVL